MVLLDNGYNGVMSNLQEKSDNFEDELDEFFKERALFRAQNVCDSSKVSSASLRVEEETIVSFPKREIDEGMSGCCMTGCFDCPWDYKVPV